MLSAVIFLQIFFHYIIVHVISVSDRIILFTDLFKAKRFICHNTVIIMSVDIEEDTVHTVLDCFLCNELHTVMSKMLFTEAFLYIQLTKIGLSVTGIISEKACPCGGRGTESRGQYRRQARDLPGSSRRSGRGKWLARL